MPSKCIVAYCGNRGMHRLPRNEVRKTQWIQAIKHVKHGRTTTAKTVICSEHFLITDFLPLKNYTPSRRFLKKTAIPSVFPWNTISQDVQESIIPDQPTSSVENTLSVKRDFVRATYSRVPRVVIKEELITMDIEDVSEDPLRLHNDDSVPDVKPDLLSDDLLSKSESVGCHTSSVRHNGYTSWQSKLEHDLKLKPYSGPSNDKIESIRSTHMPPAIANIYKKPVLLHQGHMQWLYDHEGRRYLDLAAGNATVSVGHSNPKVVSALKDQVDTLMHSTNIYQHPNIYEYIEKLASKFPGDLKVVYLVNSHSEANDLAIRLAKLYTGNNDIISLHNSYHGRSSGLMSLTATQIYRLRDTVLPDPLRGPWGGCRNSLSQTPGACNCDDECHTIDKYIDQLNNVLVKSVSVGRVAAIIAESIQGDGGILQFPKGYLKKAQELIKRDGGVFIADEAQTGFGRTGSHYWGFESHGIVPDIVTMAKGIGNGFPLAAVVTTKEIAAVHKATYFNTFGGNPMACAVGKAVLDVIEEEKLQENSKTVGDYFIQQLMQLQKMHPVIGDVRGKGLMIGVEFVVPGSLDPLPGPDIAVIFESMKDLGVLGLRGGRWGNVLMIKPPMCITKDDVDFAISVFDKAIKNNIKQSQK